MFAVIPNEISTVAKAQWAAQLDLWTALNAKALDSVTKLAELNMHAAHDAMARSSTAFQQMGSTGNPSAPSWVNPNQAQPDFGNALEYGRQTAAIVLDMRTECLHLLQAHVVEANRQIAAMFDHVGQNSPDGAGGVVEFMRAALSNANTGYSQFMKTSEQAAEAMAASLNGSAGKVDPAPSRTAGSARTQRGAR